MFRVGLLLVKPKFRRNGAAARNGGTWTIRSFINLLCFNRTHMKRISTLLVGMTVSVFFTLCLPVFAESSGVEEPLNFRVSGIMKFGNDDFRGLIEAPDKSKRTLREGDTIDDWTVARISGDCIHLRRNSQLQQRCLTGSGEAVDSSLSIVKPSAIGAVAIKDALNNSPDEEKNRLPPHFKKIDKTDFLQALDGHQTYPDRLTIDRLGESLLPLAGIPPDYRIVEIEAAAPQSAEAAMKMMRESIDQSRPIRLTLKSGEGAESIIYLHTE